MIEQTVAQHRDFPGANRAAKLRVIAEHDLGRRRHDTAEHIAFLADGQIRALPAVECHLLAAGFTLRRHAELDILVEEGFADNIDRDRARADVQNEHHVILDDELVEEVGAAGKLERAELVHGEIAIGARRECQRAALRDIVVRPAGGIIQLGQGFHIYRSAGSGRAGDRRAGIDMNGAAGSNLTGDRVFTADDGDIPNRGDVHFIGAGITAAKDNVAVGMQVARRRALLGALDGDEFIGEKNKRLHRRDFDHGGVVDRQEGKLIVREPAVAIAADRAANDIRWIAQHPGLEGRAAGIADAQLTRQHAAAGIIEFVLEGVPAGGGDGKRIAPRVLGIRTRARGVVARADDKARAAAGAVGVVVKAAVEHEIAAMRAGRNVDRGGEIKARVIRGGGAQIEVNVELGKVACGGKLAAGGARSGGTARHEAVTSPVGGCARGLCASGAAARGFRVKAAGLGDHAVVAGRHARGIERATENRPAAVVAFEALCVEGLRESRTAYQQKSQGGRKDFFHYRFSFVREPGGPCPSRPHVKRDRSGRRARHRFQAVRLGAPHCRRR